MPPICYIASWRACAVPLTARRERRGQSPERRLGLLFRPLGPKTALAVAVGLTVATYLLYQLF